MKIRLRVLNDGRELPIRNVILRNERKYLYIDDGMSGDNPLETQQALFRFVGETISGACPCEILLESQHFPDRPGAWAFPYDDGWYMLTTDPVIIASAIARLGHAT